MPKYIEYEALKKNINDAQAEKDKFPFNSLYEIGYHNGLTMALTLAMQSPAADVAPVRHGHLISTGMDELWAEFGNCTECGGDNYIKAEFCNWCGAKLT